MSPTDQLIAAYYDSLSPQDRKELEAWAQFAIEQIADLWNTAPDGRGSQTAQLP